MKNRALLAIICFAAVMSGCATRVDVEIQDTPGKRAPVAMRGNPNQQGAGMQQPMFPVQVPNPMPAPAIPPAEAAVLPSPIGGIPQVVAPNPSDNRIPVAFEKTIYFDFDSYVIREEYLSLLQKHANFFKTGGKASKVIIEGHTDVRGSAEYNLSLGQKRAEAVAQALRQNGVPAGVIDAVSYGKERPAAPGDSDTAHAQNRRATINYE